MTDWQDISTAPKDGTRILVCGGTHHSVGNFDFTSDLTEPEIAYWTGREWFAGYQEAYGDYYRCEPTHWQPLPAFSAPPAQGGA